MVEISIFSLVNQIVKVDKIKYKGMPLFIPVKKINNNSREKYIFKKFKFIYLEINLNITYLNSMKFLKILILSFILSLHDVSSQEPIPNLVGTWTGVNKTLSEQRGFRSWEKKVEILEQKDRRFKGTFSYTDGTKNFFGVIHPDNQTITWVASNSRGYNMAKLLGTNLMSACYIESGIDATAGCAKLKRK